MTLRLFRASLETGDLARCAAVLSADEHQRAAAFVFPHLRRRFTIGRAFLRFVLAGHTGADPAALRFRYGPHGKPALEGGGDLCFNLSHSDDLALLAVGRTGELGVDVERLRPLSDLEAIARTVYCDSELAVLQALGPEGRHSAFFRLWARKEAVLKALGTGFSLSAKAVEVAAGPEAVLLHLGGEAPAAALRLYDLDAGEGFAAALALPVLGDDATTTPPIEEWCA